MTATLKLTALALLRITMLSYSDTAFAPPPNPLMYMPARL